MIKKIVKKIIGILLKIPFLPARFYYFGFNGRVAIEPTNVCNLKCRLCPTWQHQNRERGFMRLDDFKVVIDDNSNIFKRINMIFAGEPLMNQDVFKMVKYAEDKNIEVLLSTNTTLFNDAKIKELFDSKLSYLIVCLDGASKGTHEQYRQGSNFEAIKENIRKICEIKKQNRFEKPYIALQFLVMRQNEHEIRDAIKMAENLGVDKIDFKTLSLGSFVDFDKKIELAEQNLPGDIRYSRFTFKDSVLKAKSKPQICSWMRQAVILWNGDVSMCCYDFNGELTVGNVFNDGGFKRILKGKKYRSYRKAAIQRKFKLCQNCNFSGETTKTIIFNNNK